MSRATTLDRLAVKTPESAFVHVLQEEFNFSLRVSRELLSTAKEMLVGGVPSSAVRPGQVRLVVVSLKAPFGPPLTETDKVEVTLTVDAGAEDAVVRKRDKAEGLRRGQILRLMDEALEQGGVLTQDAGGFGAGECLAEAFPPRQHQVGGVSDVDGNNHTLSVSNDEALAFTRQVTVGGMELQEMAAWLELPDRGGNGKGPAADKK